MYLTITSHKYKAYYKDFITNPSQLLILRKIQRGFPNSNKALPKGKYHIKQEYVRMYTYSPDKKSVSQQNPYLKMIF